MIEEFWLEFLQCVREYRAQRTPSFEFTESEMLALRCAYFAGAAGTLDAIKLTLAKGETLEALANEIFHSMDSPQ